MKSVTRNVREIEAPERSVYEAVLGHKLQENQQVVLQVITAGEQSEKKPAPSGTTPPHPAQLPKWCNVYEGLSDVEIEDLESVILDRSGSIA